MIQNPFLSNENLEKIFKTNSKDSSSIISREGTTIEFKESYNNANMSHYFKTIAAFANNNGGYIIFGIGDSPRRLLGLNEKSLQQFESLKVEIFTKNLLDYFSPEIKWDHRTFEFQQHKFGVIYVFQLSSKPCICKKQYFDKDTKYSLNEGDIYYRYGGRSEKIKYGELSNIIKEAKENEEKQWLEFIKKVAKIGIENSGILDLNSGEITGKAGTIVLDEQLLKKIAFIKEGKFVETNGTPTLRLIGDVTEIATSKVIVTEHTKKVTKALEQHDIINAFFAQEKVDEPLEYIKRICSCTTAYLPVYFYINQMSKSVSEIIDILKAIPTRYNKRQMLIDRLKGIIKINKKEIHNLNTSASKDKENYRQQWLKNSIPNEIDNLGHCIDAIFCLSEKEIVANKKNILSKLQFLYDKYYLITTPLIVSEMRKAICRIDEVLYKT